MEAEKKRYPYKPIHDMHCDHTRQSCEDVGCYGADPNEIISTLQAQLEEVTKELVAERDAARECNRINSNDRKDWQERWRKLKGYADQIESREDGLNLDLAEVTAERAKAFALLRLFRAHRTGDDWDMPMPSDWLSREYALVDPDPEAQEITEEHNEKE